MRLVRGRYPSGSAGVVRLTLVAARALAALRAAMHPAAAAASALAAAWEGAGLE